MCTYCTYSVCVCTHVVYPGYTTVTNYCCYTACCCAFIHKHMMNVLPVHTCMSYSLQTFISKMCNQFSIIHNMQYPGMCGCGSFPHFTDLQ